MKRRKIIKKIWKDRRAKKIQLNMTKHKNNVIVDHNHNDKVEYSDNLIDNFIHNGFRDKLKCGAKVKVDVPSDFVFYSDVDKSLGFLKKIVFKIIKS